jgi:5-formyltetrahydrofolate cyclo-ligase
MSQDPLKLAKAELRRQLKSAVAAISPADRQSRSADIVDRLWALPAVQDARSVFCFVSNGPEVHTHGLIDRLVSAGKPVYVPKIIGRTRMIASPFHGWDALRPAELGILTPISDEAHDGPVDLAITPGLGFSLRGQRIGYGAGYYDRWFAAHAVDARIAVAFEVQIVDHIPTDAYDLPVHRIVTEERVIVPSAKS